ncbi:MAG: hypothetical protein ACJA2D_002415 [Pseudohongiellaceae bacterium]|jgi:hypothetical protein
MFVFECRTHDKDCLVFFLGQYANQSKSFLIESVQKAYLQHLTPELVLFVYPSYLESAIASLLAEEGVVTDLTRENYTPVLCFSFNANGQFVEENVLYQAIYDRSLKDAVMIAGDVVKAGYDDLMRLRKKEVLVKSPAGTTFVKPSGGSLEEFIYAAQLARNNFEYQFLAFSLLSHAPKDVSVSTIYIDTTGIAPIAEAVVYYLSRFSGGQCKHITYKSFSSYSGLEETKKPENTRCSWVIISASSSTGLGKKLLGDWNLKPEQVVTILSYKPLLTEGDENKGNAVVYCLNKFSKRDDKNYSPTKVQVQGESFSVEVSDPQRILLLKKFKPDIINESINPYIESNVFSVNRGERLLHVDYPELRKMYADDSGSLIKEDAEKNHLYKWIEQVVCWSIPKKFAAVIFEDTDECRLLLKDFKDVLGENHFMDYQVVKHEDQKALNDLKCDAVLVLSPAVSTGHIFIDVNRALRLADHSGMRIFATPFVVAPSRDQFKNVNTSLTEGPNGFKYAYLQFRKMYLSSKNLSPWKKELDFVIKLINRCDEDDKRAEYWEQRKALLENYDAGLGKLIGNNYQAVDDVLELAPDFVFWPEGYDVNEVNASAVFATMGNILQNLRDNEIDGKQLSANIYQHSVIDPENFVRFNDPILQVCLWRCAMPGELDYRRSDTLSCDMQRILNKIFSSSDSKRGVTSLDLLIALAIRWIKLSDTEMDKVLKLAEKYLKQGYAQILIEYMIEDFNSERT